jgi:hypothetical protein
MTRRTPALCRLVTAIALVPTCGWLALAGEEASPPVDHLAPAVDVARVPPGEHGAARLEERWGHLFDVAEVEVRVPSDAFERLDHELAVELLDRDGRWVTVAAMAVSPSAVGAPAASPVVEDPDAVEFLAALGLSVEQFELLASGPLAEGMLAMWEVQGIARDDVPASVLRVLEPDEAHARAEPLDGGWQRTPGWALRTERLEFPQLARGVRFTLTGDSVLSEAWQLVVRTVLVPDARDGFRTELWYTHAW